MRYPHHLTPEELGFINELRNADPNVLYLKYHGQPEKRYLISQISARRKLRKKLPQWLENEQVQFPEGLPQEQASSEATARLKASLIQGEEMIDLTGGLGVDAFYLSQSFNDTYFVEKDKNLVDYARHNFEVLGSAIHVKEGLAETVLRESTADVVYIDPHRRGESNRRQFRLEEHEPNVLEMLPLLLKPGRHSLIKTSPMLDISMALEQLKQVIEIWVISVRNDCKEVVYLLSGEKERDPLIRCFNLGLRIVEKYTSQTTSGETPQISHPKVFIYEANASVMKAGLQDQLALDFNLSKLHPHSHLYTSEQFFSDFPGRKFKVTSTHRAWDKSLKNGRYNVVCRNFPQKAPVIEKRLRIKPSDKDYLLATSLVDEQAVFIRAEIIDMPE